MYKSTSSNIKLVVEFHSDSPSDSSRILFYHIYTQIIFFVGGDFKLNKLRNTDKISA